MDIKQARTSLAADAAALACKTATAGLLLLGAACSSHAPERQNEALVRGFAAKGYAAIEHDTVVTTNASWPVSGQNVQMVLAKPVRSGSTPVVIYLPGLGEASDAGASWRTAWAAAGYAVISVQLLDDDVTAWRSDLARAGEFKALGRQHYAGAVMSRRTHLLADLVAEGRRRSSAGEAPWQQLDWNRLAIAGYDLGAYTAMTVAGEHVRDADDANGRLQIRATIALSPYASMSGGTVDDRYRDISAPVMSVTSDVDTDPLGLVEGAHLREAPFTRMPGPEKYLLSLQGLPHSGLSGGVSDVDAKGSKSEGEGSKRAQGASGGDGTGPGQHRRGGKRGDSAGTGSGDPQKSARDRSGSGEGAIPAGLSASERQMRIIAAQDVSTAFLDAYLKGDPLAREWLAVDASRWLGTAGELRRK